MKPVLVLAATGQVGRYVAAGLAGRGVEVRAVTRDPERAAKWFADSRLSTENVQFVAADIHDAGSIRAAAEGCGQAYIASGDAPDQVETEVEAAKIALDAGATHIVKLSSCDASAGASFSWARHHAEIEKQIAAMTPNFSFLRPHYFMQNLFSFADEIETTGAMALPSRDGRAGMIDSRDIAAVAVKILISEEPLRRTVELTGPEPTSFKRAAAAISNATGHDVEFNDVSDDEYLRLLRDRDGMSDEHAAEIARVYQDVRNGFLDIRTDEVQRITGIAPRAIEQFASDFAHRFPQ